MPACLSRKPQDSGLPTLLYPLQFDQTFLFGRHYEFMATSFLLFLNCEYPINNFMFFMSFYVISHLFVFVFFSKNVSLASIHSRFYLNYLQGHVLFLISFTEILVTSVLWAFISNIRQHIPVLSHVLLLTCRI